ncbi:MAG TPA: DUF1573 domain-containing protein [Flavisolibacter sp.]|jgi:hypothetical protein|nr:DUF1573 domain-containing protein [Flavisolibacter sp.]
MKFLFLALSGASFLVACNAGDTTATAGVQDSANRQTTLNAAYDSSNFTQIQWVDSVHQDLGKVKEGSLVEITWRFTNTGNRPLIISNVSAGCGCTVAEKPEEPIAAGKEGVIKAKFDSKGRMGTQMKDVYVAANTGDVPQKLSFAVEVEK